MSEGNLYKTVLTEKKDELAIALLLSLFVLMSFTFSFFWGFFSDTALTETKLVQWSSGIMKS